MVFFHYFPSISFSFHNNILYLNKSSETLLMCRALHKKKILQLLLKFVENSPTYHSIKFRYGYTLHNILVNKKKK